MNSSKLFLKCLDLENWIPCPYFYFTFKGVCDACSITALYPGFLSSLAAMESPGLWENFGWQAGPLCSYLQPLHSVHEDGMEDRWRGDGGNSGDEGERWWWSDCEAKTEAPVVSGRPGKKPWSVGCLSWHTRCLVLSFLCLPRLSLSLFPFLLHFFSLFPPPFSNCGRRNTMNHWYSFFSHGCIFQLLGI